MVGIWTEDFMRAKYHLAVAERMFKSYSDFESKRFLIGVINELAKSASFLIRAFLIFEKQSNISAHKGLETFRLSISPKYIDKVNRENILKVLEVQKAIRVSPIAFDKKGELILLIDGKYRFVTTGRIGEFLESVRTSILKFPYGRQI